MTISRTRILLAFAMLGFLALPAAAGQAAADEGDAEVGIMSPQLVFRGAIALDPKIGVQHVTGLIWDHGHLDGITAEGRWFAVDPADSDGRLSQATLAASGDLLDQGRHPIDAPAFTVTRTPSDSVMIGFKGRGFLVYPRLDRPGVPVQNTNIFPLRDNGLPIELPQDQSYRFAAIFDRIAATGIEAGMTTIWPDRVSVCPTVVDHAIKCTDFSAYQRRDSSSLPILPDGDWQPMAAGEADPCNGRGGQFSIVSEQSLAGRSLVLFSEPKDRLLASVSNRRGGPLHGVAAHWQDGTCRVYAASDNEGHDDLPTMLYEFELKPDR